jgi:ComF family protein
VYQAPIDSIVQGLKFHGRLSHARLLGVLLADHLRHSHCRKPHLIVPVPLHVSRLRQRGFNQAVEIARPVARSLSIDLDIHCCRRTKPTDAQSTLAVKERRHNIKGAFAVNRVFHGESIAVIDDVMTTGHTVAEMARMLLRAGAGQVDVWVCARTP